MGKSSLSLMIAVISIAVLLIVSCNVSTVTVTSTAIAAQTFTTTTSISRTITSTTTITATVTYAKPLIPDANLEAVITEELYLSGRPVYKSDLETITALVATGRFISDLTGLKYCIKLQVLEIPQNNISNLSPLSGLPSLRIINLRSNFISDISPLVGNSALGEGAEIYLENNNLDLTDDSEDMQDIKALQDRGVTVIY